MPNSGVQACRCHVVGNERYPNTLEGTGQFITSKAAGNLSRYTQTINIHSERHQGNQPPDVTSCRCIT